MWKDYISPKSVKISLYVKSLFHGSYKGIFNTHDPGFAADESKQTCLPIPNPFSDPQREREWAVGSNMVRGRNVSS